jgi:hypothetical protein
MFRVEEISVISVRIANLHLVQSSRSSPRPWEVSQSSNTFTAFTICSANTRALDP